MNSLQFAPDVNVDLFGFVASPTQIPAKIEVIKSPSALKPATVRTVKAKVTADPLEESESTEIFGSLNLYKVFEDDSADTKIAKRMLRRTLDDITEKPNGSGAGPDMFNHIDGDHELNKLDALIWLYELNPDGSDISFTWVCDEIGLDSEAFRRVIARFMRQDLKRVLQLLAQMISFDHAKHCEIELSDYVNLSGWNLN